MLLENRYKVPKTQWSKWLPPSQDVFNVVYGVMIENQRIFQHPKAVPLDPEHWKTTAWNAAWIAADAVVGE